MLFQIEFDISKFEPSNLFCSQSKLEFESNLLSVTSVDIQSVEPVDQKTKDSLMKSVQLAIEITTNAQEATAKHEAQRIEQEAKVSKIPKSPNFTN